MTASTLSATSRANSPGSPRAPAVTPPRTGMVATVRNRRGVISAVRPFDGPDGRLHLVDIAYNDGETPLEESLLWEREPRAHVLPPAALPEPDRTDPMRYDDFIALLRACRWSARMPFIDPDGSGPMDRLPVTSPFHGAVQVEDYQLVPLLKALRMPRVSLLVADDVGLGKTIEAGLILSELLLRRRIRRVLIMTPASLRVQWLDEMWQKFSLPFDIVDRDSTVLLKREMGMDANPWRSRSRIITSYHYLKQADILADFENASHLEGSQARLPWDLLIVDEAHNLTPNPIGEESDLCQMLRRVAPLFEHRIFLTATPHNGHTRSFTGLLEMLDPVRFSQTDQLSAVERTRVQDVLIRRLKREINARSDPKRFCDRLPPQALAIELSPEEERLSVAFSGFRKRVRAVIREASRRRRLAGNFAIEILGKRLLSCPTAFAESWARVRAGLQEEEEALAGETASGPAVDDAEVLASKRAVEEEDVDDREAESRRQTAAKTVGLWLRPIKDVLAAEIAAIDRALASLGLQGCDAGIGDITAIDPRQDARYQTLLSHIRRHLSNGSCPQPRASAAWRDDERLVIFTEYKTTLDYLLRRLRHDLGDSDRVLFLYGGMDDEEREAVKRAFNDPADRVRILIGTDAASEGLNLQETARYLLHYDIPWNPARLEQRNGRLDRHGQPRDVQVWHFMSNDDQDLAFLDFVVRKVDAIREDLGATGEVFDEITHRRLIEGEDLATVRADLERKVERVRGLVDLPRDDRANAAAAATAGEAGRMVREPEAKALDPAADLRTIAAELDFDPEALRTTLDGAMALAGGRPRVGSPDPTGRCEIVQPHPTTWAPVIDDTVRLPAQRGVVGALPALAFDPQTFVVSVGGRPVFRPRRDTLLMHLGHPMLQKALSALTRLRFPGQSGSEREASRWAVHRGDVPSGADALLVVSVEELAINELRETFHHWVRTVRFPVKDGRLGEPLPHVPALALRDGSLYPSAADVEGARDVWIDLRDDVRAWAKVATEKLSENLRRQLDLDQARALEDENARYQSRQGEVSALIESNTLARLEKELVELKRQQAQGLLFNQLRELEEMESKIEAKEEELARRSRHYEEVREQLAQERERITKHLIPKRHAMRGDAQIMPVAVEIVLPGGGR